MAMTSRGGRAVDDAAIGGGDEERHHCRYEGQRRVRSPAASATATDTSMQPSAPTNDGDDYTTRASDDSASPRMVIPTCCRQFYCDVSYPTNHIITPPHDIYTEE